jgi:hypothetical protein
VKGSLIQTLHCSTVFRFDPFEKLWKLNLQDAGLETIDTPPSARSIG